MPRKCSIEYCIQDLGFLSFKEASYLKSVFERHHAKAFNKIFKIARILS